MKAPTKETPLTAYQPKQQSRKSSSLLPVAMFIAERLVQGSLAVLIVYSGYRLFML